MLKTTQVCHFLSQPAFVPLYSIVESPEHMQPCLLVMGVEIRAVIRSPYSVVKLG